MSVPSDGVAYCAKCRFYSPDSVRPGQPPTGSGRCRYDAPRFVVITEGSYQHAAPLAGYWPAVYMADWCGRFDGGSK